MVDILGEAIEEPHVTKENVLNDEDSQAVDVKHEEFLVVSLLFLGLGTKELYNLCNLE